MRKIITLLLILISCEKESGEIKVPQKWLDYLGKSDKIFLDSDKGNVWILKKEGEIFHLSITSGWNSEKINVEGEIVGIKAGNIIIHKNNEVYILTRNKEVLKTGLSTDNPYYILSPSSFVFWEEGKVKILDKGKTVELFDFGDKPENMYADYFDNDLMVFLNSKGRSYFYFRGALKRLGEFIRRRSVSFSLTGDGRYVSVLPEENMGNISGDVRLLLNGSEFKDFSYEIQGNQLILYVYTSPEKLPPNSVFEVEYRVSPTGTQIGFGVLSDGKKVYVTDTEIRYSFTIPGTDEKRNICASYLSFFDGSYFQRFQVLPSDSCDVFFSLSENRYAFSFLKEEISSLFLLWGNISASYDLRGIAYPLVFPEFPYFVVVLHDEEKNVKIILYELY